MSPGDLYDRYGWQSSLDRFSSAEPRVVRLQLQHFIADASPEQVRAWDQSIPWLQRECRELEARNARGANTQSSNMSFRAIPVDRT